MPNALLSPLCALSLNSPLQSGKVDTATLFTGEEMEARRSKEIAQSHTARSIRNQGSVLSGLTSEPTTLNYCCSTSPQTSIDVTPGEPLGLGPHLPLFHSARQCLW